MFRKDPEDIAPRSAEQGRYSMRPQVCEGVQACERQRPPTSRRRTVSDARRLPVEPGLLVAGPVVGDVVRDEVPDVRPVNGQDDTAEGLGVTHGVETMAQPENRVKRKHPSE